MKSKVKDFVLIFLLFTMVSCGGGNINDDANLSAKQKDAVTYVKRHLQRGEKLVDYEVVEEPVPASIIEQPFLNLRNIVFKAGLDYQSCKTRGLEAGMKMAETKISDARAIILSTEESLNNRIGDSKSIIVLAHVKKGGNEPYSLVVVFDPENMTATEWIPVTAPVQNTVSLVVSAREDTLFEYAREQNHDSKSLASRVKDPVLKFVLESRAI